MTAQRMQRCPQSWEIPLEKSGAGVVQEVDEEALVKAAERMESVMLSMSLGQLLPQKLAYA